ncbi:MAG TPA: phosphatidylglycerophosphatase A [Ignavibacteria bacterium]|nr:phosphatidylglycerophosphatase A [Ignavibacteria bacterium]HQY52261.1 phosphatidylglycerophosphatase A [Ignavibacteria bacterium]HRB01066.1 phosphatidylglycerophosphatase A [Ignavibacteria bacterium]
MRFLKKRKITDENFKPDIFSVIFSSCFYIGYIPFASGTFGSIFGILFFLINGFTDPVILIPVIILSFIVGIYTSGVMMKRFGDDPSEVVVDEVIGMWITVLVFLILDPSVASLNSGHYIILFMSFRFFDIFKIQPAKYFDELDTAFGVMMDDVFAGVYAGIVSFFLFMIINNFI